MKGFFFNLLLFIIFLSYWIQSISKIPSIDKLELSSIFYFLIGSFLICILIIFLPLTQKHKEFMLTLKFKFLGFFVYCIYYIIISIIIIFSLYIYFFESNSCNIKLLDILSIIYLIKNAVLQIIPYYKNINNFNFSLKNKGSFIINFILISYFILNNQIEIIRIPYNLKESIFLIIFIILNICFIIRFIIFNYNIKYSNILSITNINIENYIINLRASFTSFLITFCILFGRFIYLKYINLLKSIEIINYKQITVQEVEFLFVFLIVINLLFIIYLTMIKKQIMKNPSAKIVIFEKKWVFLLILIYIIYFIISIYILRPFFFDILQVLLPDNANYVSYFSNNIKYKF